MHAWMNDVAQNIIEYPDIAERYDFPSEAAMTKFIKDNPEIRRRLKQLRAIWQSDDNVEVRTRVLAGYAVLEAIPHTSQVMYDPTATSAAKLEALKAHARIAGLDGMPSHAKDVIGGASVGGKFSINFIFSDRVEKITTLEARPEPQKLEEVA